MKYIRNIVYIKIYMKFYIIYNSNYIKKILILIIVIFKYYLYIGNYNNLLIKFVLYFIISLLLLLSFWYYISLFCIIYKNTQIHLLKDTLMSFGLSLIIPFIFYLLPGIFRIPSLSNSNKKRECLYNFSKILQFI